MSGGRVPEEEMITIPLSELKRKNDILWLFVHHHFPFAQGSLDDYLNIVVEKEMYDRARLSVQVAAGDIAIGEYRDETSRLKAEVEKCEKVIEERGYAFQDSVQKAMQERDAWKARFHTADNLLTIEKSHARKLEGALEIADLAIQDWLHIYASQECGEKDVSESMRRIKEHGGILGYITDVTKIAKAALPEFEKGV